MKKIAIFRPILFILLLIIIFTACSDYEDATNDAEVLWSKEVLKGCRNKDPFAFGPSSNFNVKIDNFNDILYFEKYDLVGSGSTGMIDEIGYRTRNYRLGILKQDPKSKTIYSMDRGSSSLVINEMDDKLLTRKRLLTELDERINPMCIEFYNGHGYLVEFVEGEYHFVGYDLENSERTLIHTFEVPINKKVKLAMLYDFNGKIKALFSQSNDSPPYTDKPNYIQIDVEEGDREWEKEFNKFAKAFYTIDNELYAMFNDGTCLVLESQSGDEADLLTLSNSEGVIKDIVGDRVVFETWELDGNDQQMSRTKIYDLVKRQEVLEIEGSYLALGQNTIYTIGQDRDLIFQELSGSAEIRRIEMTELVGSNLIFRGWQMNTKHKQVLTMKEDCDAAEIFLIQLP